MATSYINEEPFLPQLTPCYQVSDEAFKDNQLCYNSLVCKGFAANDMSVADTEDRSATHYTDPDNGNTDSVRNYVYLHFTQD